MPRLIKRIISPIESFMALETSGSIMLIICTAFAMIAANSPMSEAYHHFVHAPVGFKFGTFDIEKSFLHWVNDGLMVIFFFVVGMEIKKEMVMGELSTPRKAALPMFAALGGMVVPALIYYFFNHSVAPHGWGIPTATDIAFAVGVLTLMGKRAPFALKVFLLALAIVDDLGAVLVIAFFYTDEIHSMSLGITAAMLALTFILGRSGVRSFVVYILIGIVAWFALLKSGVHATIAGVLLGFLTPTKPLHNISELPDQIKDINDRLNESIAGDVATHSLQEKTKTYLRELNSLASEGESPLDRLIHALHPWVSFFIMPIFALVNAGVDLSGIEFSHLFENSISMGVTLGLFLGKPIGIVLACVIAVKANLAQLPKGISWKQIIAAGCLGGIGFTMSLFVTGLAFNGDHHLEIYSKLGILMASALASIVGCLVLLLVSVKNEA